MKQLHGDLIELAVKQRLFDVIVHGANCQHVMGSGIAKSIRRVFPEAYQADCDTPKGAGKLGSISYANACRVGATGIFQITVVNAYTQVHYGAGKQVDYDAIRRAFRTVYQRFGDKRIGYPKIGAGLGGGDWDVLKAIIDEELRDADHTLVLYDSREHALEVHEHLADKQGNCSCGGRWAACPYCETTTWLFDDGSGRARYCPDCLEYRDFDAPRREFGNQGY